MTYLFVALLSVIAGAVAMHFLHNELEKISAEVARDEAAAKAVIEDFEKDL